MKRFFIPFLLLLVCSPVMANGQGGATLSTLSAEEKSGLLDAMQCPASTWDRLFKIKAGFDVSGTLSTDGTMCELAVDAFCTSSPDHAVCLHREPRGAYAGYYLMRYAMPVVVMLRKALRNPEPTSKDKELMDTGFDTVFRILRLMSPNLRGCDNLQNVRTWCTAIDDSYHAVSSHRAAVAYLASESLRLLAECRERDEVCPLSTDRLDRALARWFDVLLWDHVLLDGTVLRNSLTRDFSNYQPAILRLHYLYETYESQSINRAPFQFATDGWWMAVAANLLAVDVRLSGEGDPRAAALTAQQNTALMSLVDIGMEVLDQHAETTQLRDFEGHEVTGLQFDSKLWDRHEYRRFSAVSEGPRPFSVALDPSDNKPKIAYAQSDEQRAENVGLDSGHYRRLTWLHYTLSDVEELVDADWVDDDILVELSNQFAYGVYWHDCHHTRPDGCASNHSELHAQTVPRFVNYVSGQQGWYRLTPTQPCEAGVPPFGFSTLMVISENLWWAKFNDDISRIWARLDTALNEPNLPPPSQGDTVPCGKDMGTSRWGQSYNGMAFDTEGHLTRYGLGFYAMKYWAELTLRGQ